jgi:hypothetical protein
MLKMKAKTDNGDIVIFGLSNENIKRMKQNKPMLIDLKELGIPGVKIMIFTGETEDKMFEDLKELIRPEMWSENGPKSKN